MIQDLKGRHAGEQVFLVASGPSFNDFPKEELPSRKVISINRTAFYLPHFDYWVSYSESRQRRADDVHSYPNYKEKLAGKPIFVIRGQGGHYPLSTVYECEVLGRNDFSLDLAKGIFNGYGSGFYALQVAVYLGFSKIHLVGFDQANKDGEAHFYKDGVEYSDIYFQRVRSAFRQAYFSKVPKDVEITPRIL